MCIIIDTNKINYFFNNPKAKDAKPIHDWLDEEKNRVVVYPARGKYAKELKNVKTKLQDLSRRGVAVRFRNSNKIESEQKILGEIGKCKSNDIPVLAFARACGARLLYTADANLIDDFKNKEIIDNPRGKVYSSAGNKDLLEKTVCKKITE